MGPSRRVTALALLAVLGLAAFLRFRNVAWGLPEFLHPDERFQFLDLARRAEGSGFRDLRPLSYAYPPGHAMTVAAALRACRRVPLRASGCVDDLDVEADAARVARVWTALLSVLTVGGVFAAARAFTSTRGALLAAVALAVAGFHAVYAPFIGPDTPLVFWMTVSLACALGAARSGGRFLFFLAGVAAGMAAATKYPGGLALAPALVAALSARGTRWREIAAVACGAIVGGLAGCPRSLVDAPTIANTLRFYGTFVLTTQQGWAGVDLFPGSPLAHHYVYPLFAALPSMLGWPLYVVALVGLVQIARIPGPPRRLLASLLVPYFLLMGAATISPPRWYLPLLLPLAIAAGVAFEAWLRSSRPGVRRVGAVAAVVVLGVSFAYAWSWTGARAFASQRALARWLATADGSTAGYPDRTLFPYDGLSALVRPLPLRWVFLPSPIDGKEPDYEAWFGRARPDLIVWPSFMETRLRRNYPGGRGVAFLAGLDDGRLGYRQVATFPTHYLGQEFYARLDPMFPTVWELGLVGYRVFARAGAIVPPPATGPP